jgi:thiamine-monophosphate kinase
MNERDLIHALTQGFPRAPEQLNATYEADAEILRLGTDLWAATVDDFSAEEDLFFDADPRLIGWNVVAATLSDLLCVGAVPRFFLPAVCIPQYPPENFLKELTEGAREALDTAECYLIGGDVGRADPWRYVGVAFGSIGSANPLTRRIPSGNHTLWVSGPLGGANVAAATGSPPPRFPLHLEVAEILREMASASTDTSGGFCEAVWNVSQVSPGARIEVDVDALPLAPEVAAFADAHGILPEAALLGGAGEYEIIFTVPEQCSDTTRSRLETAGCRAVGTVTEGEGAGVFYHQEGGEISPMTEAPPCPRASATTRDHIRDVAAMAQALFGGGTG